MSYDLMVFEQKKVPKTKLEFMEWYHKLAQWEEGHSYDDVSICCPELQGWYQEMLKTFPAMNGPDYSADFDDEMENRLTDYCIAKDAVYIAFAWSTAELAYETVVSLARKHGVGFFDVSGSEGDIILSDGSDIIS